MILPAYKAWRTGTSSRVVVPARQAGYRFLCFLKGLQIRAQKDMQVCKRLCQRSKPLSKKICTFPTFCLPIMVKFKFYPLFSPELIGIKEMYTLGRLVGKLTALRAPPYTPIAASPLHRLRRMSNFATLWDVYLSIPI